MKKIIIVVLGFCCCISTVLYLIGQADPLAEAIRKNQEAIRAQRQFITKGPEYRKEHQDEFKKIIADVQQTTQEVMTVGAKVAAEQKKAEQQISFGDIDYKQIGEILKQVPELTKLLATLGQDELAKDINKVAEPIAKVGDLLTDMKTFEGHVNQIVKSSKDLSKRVVCIKGSKEARSKSDICKNLNCIEHGQCVVAGLGDVLNILTPFINDILLGYDDGRGNKKPGLAYVVLDIAQQQQYKQQLDSLRAPIKEILEVIEQLKKIIKQG